MTDIPFWETERGGGPVTDVMESRQRLRAAIKQREDEADERFRQLCEEWDEPDEVGIGFELFEGDEEDE